MAHPTTEWGPNSEIQIGEQAEAKWGVLDVRHPIDRGVVADWEDMERIWSHAFLGLGTDPTSHPVLLTEAPTNPKAHRERMVSLMFGTFGVPAVHVNGTAVLSLFAYGKTTGCVLESGDHVTHAVPICEGYAITHAITRLDLGGRDLTDLLQGALAERGHPLKDIEVKSVTKEGMVVHTLAVQLQVRFLKESLGYVASNFDEEMIKAVDNCSALEESYELPDGNDVVVGTERFYYPEHLFQPEDLAGLEGEGVADATYQSIMKCDERVRGDMFANIVLSGGGTLFPGFRERVRGEIADLAPPSVEVAVQAPPEREYSAWLGGSVVASLPQFREMWISRAEYDQSGPAIVHKKCF